MLKNLTFAFPLFFLLSFFALLPQGKTAHIVGGEITYECLGYTNGDTLSGSRTYQFVMKVYRDCAGGGANFDGPFGSFDCHVTLYHGDEVLQIIDLGGPVVQSIENETGNPCLVIPPGVCVEEGTYVFPLLDLPISDTSYSVVYQRCCRNNTINNIINPEASGATFTMELNPAAQAVCNNSPTFNAFPPTILCSGEYLSFDGSATDSDGDQLVYEFCAPLLGGGQNTNPSTSPNGLAPSPDGPSPYASVIFDAPGYTAAKPIGDNSDFSFNTVTGELSGTPVNAGQFVVGVCVSEFRNGVLLSKVSRDFQFNITNNCENLVTADIQEDFINSNDQSFSVRSCGDFNVSINNESTDENFIDAYLWEFVVNGDTVRSTNRDFAYEFPGPGTYRGVMICNPDVLGCNDSASITVLASNGVVADYAFAYDTCRADPVVFTDLSDAPDGVAEYRWTFGDNLASNLADPSHQYTEPGDFSVRLSITDMFGCEDDQVQVVSYYPVPNLVVIAPDAARACNPEDIFFDNLSSPIDDSYQVSWDFGDGGRDTAISPTHLYTTEDVFSVAVRIVSPIGCATDTVFQDLITIDAAPVAGFDYSPNPVDYFNRDLQFQDASMGANRWYWVFGEDATSILQNPQYTLPDSGLIAITQVVTHPTGCVDSLTQFIDVVPLITYNMPNAFTPNGDGRNDLYLGKGFLRGYRSFNMKIWNRWGEVFFSTDDPTVGWDGRSSNSGDAPPGVYLYQLQMVGPRGEPFTQRGTVTLVR